MKAEAPILNSPLVTFEHKRDAYGFAVRPQHVQRYREYANIYKEEEEERSDRWKDFLERQSECFQLRVNGSSAAEDTSAFLAPGSGHNDLNEPGAQNEEVTKTHRTQIWTQIRPSLGAIEDMMNARIKKKISAVTTEEDSGIKSRSFEEAKPAKAGAEEDSEEEFYDLERTEVDPTPDVPSSDGVGAASNATTLEFSVRWKEELEFLVQGGVPMALRGELWQAFVGVKARHVKNYYQDLLLPDNKNDNSAEHEVSVEEESKASMSDSVNVIEKWKGQIEKDLPRTFPGHPALDEGGRNALRRLLTAYARHNPSVGYCQEIACNHIQKMRIREPTTSLVIFSSVSKTICLSSSSRIAFLFFGLFIFLNTTTISTSYNGNETDYLALMSFKSMITQDPYGALRSWNNSFHFCDWNGVSCGKLHRRVIMLNMSSQGLVGSLSPHVGNLSFLRVFGLFDNTFQGNIPHELSHLFRLRELNLGKNNFSGVIPTNISSCSNLGKLGLHYNKLVGIIPMEFSLLSRLIILSVGHNNLTGHIPVFLGNFTSMEWFFAEVNPLGGSIPDTLGHCRSLKRLYLGRCNLYGTIPHSIYNLSLLPFFSLPGNHLMGSLPPTLGAMLPLLEYLQLRDNQLTGLLPPLISNCSNLQVLDLGNNNFSGKLIIDFASPTGTRDCQQLEGLILTGNQFEGALPSSLSKCRSLKVLDLGNNHLNGTLPVWLGGLQELQVLLLKSNKLHGPIECPATITLPFPSLKVLDLSHNGFTGYLPEKYFQNFRAMKNVVKKGTKPKYLNIGGLYYFIIVTLKGQKLLFTKFLVDYTIIDLSNNRFEGEIPNIIGSLNSLIVLNLSHNSLTGQIPHALGNLSEIESLDLSWNQLTGTIPQSLANITNLAVLNLSQNHLMGRIPEGTQFTTFEENSFRGNPGLCGHPLPKMCEHPHEPQLETNGDTDSGFTWKAMVLGYGCGTLFGMVMGYLMLSTGRPKWFNAIAEAGEYMIQKWQNKRRYVYIGK